MGRLKMEGAHVGKSEEGAGDIFALGQVTHKTVPTQCAEEAGAWILNCGL